MGTKEELEEWSERCFQSQGMKHARWCEVCMGLGKLEQYRGQYAVYELHQGI